MWFKGLVAVTCVVVIAAAAFFVVGTLQDRRDDARRQEELAADARCDELLSANADYERTGNVLALPMPFADFDREVRACQGLPPRG